MKIYVCGGKQIVGNTTQYLLRDIRSGKEHVVTGDELKHAMRSEKVDVMNLTLTSDNRLVEASKEKMAQLKDMLKAPASISDKLSPMPQAVDDAMESIMDEILHDCVKYYISGKADYAEGASKYVKLGHFDKEHNTCVLEFTLGLNSYVLLSYDKLCYGIIPRDGDGKADHTRGCACIDIVINVLGVSNRRARSKIGNGEVVKASDVISGEDCLKLDYKRSCTGDILIEDADVDTLKKMLGCSIMSYVSRQLSLICENNPDIANNTHIKDYIEYDRAKKEYRSNLAATTGAALGAAVIVGAIVALACATDPEIIQTGLLAKLVDAGSPDQIMHAIMIYGGSVGALAGATTAGKIAINSDLGRATSRSKRDVNAAKKKTRGDWMSVFGKNTK